MHIPFCKSKCDYCDFFSLPRGLVGKPYINALKSEIAFAAKKHLSPAHRGAERSSWETVYIGGGTPSLMSAEEICLLFDAIWSASGGKRSGEVTFEANPQDITEELLNVLYSCGVTRISCGFQSFDEDALSAVHRLCKAADEWRAVKMLNKLWHGVFSADLIAGLPCEKDGGTENAIEVLERYGASHISLYTLTIEDDTPLGQRIAQNGGGFDAQKADEAYISCRDRLISLGYEQYEVSSFCKDGKRCKHNEAYWKQMPYIGCGAGAVSSFYGGKAGGGQSEDAECGVRITNTNDIDRYTSYWLSHEDGEGAPRTIERLSSKTQKEEYFMLGLRTSFGVCEDEYARRFGCGMEQRALEHFTEWEKRGLAVRLTENGMTRHAMTAAGLLLLDRFLVELD